MGNDRPGLEFARSLGFAGAWTQAELPPLAWDAVMDATNAADLPARAADLAEPGGRVVYIGLAARPSYLDTRALVLKDVTATGILAGSQGLAGAIAGYAAGDVDPRPLVAATVGLDQVAEVLDGRRPGPAGRAEDSRRPALLTPGPGAQPPAVPRGTSRSRCRATASIRSRLYSSGKARSAAQSANRSA